MLDSVVSSLLVGSASGKEGLKELVVKVLSEEWPLSAREIYGRISKHSGVSYQGVHKALKQLAANRVLEERAGKYSLDIGWITGLRRAGESLERKYLKSATDFLEVGAGSSVDKDAFAAGKEAAAKAFGQLKYNKKVQLALVFASGSYKGSYSELLSGVQSVSKNAPLAGCTTTGEINGGHLKNSVTVALFGADEKVFSAKPVVMPLLQTHYEGSGFGDLLSQLEKSAEFKSGYPDLGLFFFPGYSLEKNMQMAAPAFLSEFASRFSTPFPIAGCTSGDGWVFKNTAQFCNSEVLPNAIVFVAIKTKLKFGVRRTHGYASQSGRCFKIRAKDGIISSMARIERGKTGEYEPMLKSYCKESKMRPDELTASIPKFISEVIAQNKGPPITRVRDGARGYPARVDGTGIWFENSFKTGDVVQVSTTTPEALVKTTKQAIVEAAEAAEVKKPEAALIFSCASIEAILQGHDVDEIERIRKNGLEGVKIFGCYNDGEIGPVAVPQGNGTVVAIVFGNELRA